MAKGCILVVDDNTVVGLAIEDTLIDAGYAVIGVVATGEEALDLAEVTPPDLVLMDIRRAAELDGIEAAIELRRRGLTSIFATAHVDKATKARGIAADPAGWLGKPLSPTELLNAVEAALRKAAPLRPAGLEPATKPL